MSESPFTFFHETSRDLMCLLGPDGSVREANPSFLHSIGPVKKLPSRAFVGLAHPDDQVKTREALEQLVGGKQRLIFSNRIRCHEGQYCNVEWRIGKIGDGPDLLVVGEDVDKRREAGLLDRATDAIVEWSMEGKCLFWSKGAEHSFGWSAREALGKRAEDFLVADEEGVRTAIQYVIEHGAWWGELTNHTKDGKKILVDSRWSLMRNSKGMPQSILSIETDITERKMAEGHFLRAQRMESIGMLAAGMAHDLNNVLAPVLLSVTLLKAQSPGGENSEILDTMESSIQRGAELVQQVLSFARGMEGKKVEVPLRHLVEEVGKVIRATFPPSIVINVDVARDLGSVTGDPAQLHQVLLNLAMNGRDAMPRGGRLMLRAQNVQAPAVTGGASLPHIRIDVEDSGDGGPPVRGGGRGLPASEGIVRNHGGYLQAVAIEGKGNLFHVFLPVSSKAGALDASSKYPRGNGEVVLLVDDEASILAITRHALEAFGYQVITARNGLEGVEVYTREKKRVSVVLTDMSMPLLDGPGMIEKIQEMDPQARIIGSTGQGAGSEVGRATALGINNFLNKPYTTEAMLRALKEVLA